VKRWMVVALVALLAAGLVPVAVAGIGGSDGDRSQFMVEGIVQSVDIPVDGDYNYVVLMPTTGTRDVKSFVRNATPMTIKLPKSLAVIECVPPPGSVAIPLSDVGFGDSVLARGVIDREAAEYVAFRFQLMSYAAD